MRRRQIRTSFLIICLLSRVFLSAFSAADVCRPKALENLPAWISLGEYWVNHELLIADATQNELLRYRPSDNLGISVLDFYPFDLPYFAATGESAFCERIMGTRRRINGHMV